MSSEKREKPDFFKLLDGTDRTLRPQQHHILTELTNNWDDFDAFTVIAPTAVGKTLVARTIQKAVNAAVITSSNLLVEQYKSTYPEVNVFYGQEHYTSQFAYEEAKTLSLMPENHSIYNLMSFRIASRDPSFIFPEVIVMDEAHLCQSLLSELTTKSIHINKHERFNRQLENPYNFVEFLREHYCECSIKLDGLLAKGSKSSQIRQMEARLSHLDDMIFTISQYPEKYALWYSEKIAKKGKHYYINVKPLVIPPQFIKRVFKDSKLILMSATLFSADVREILGGRSYHQIETKTPIPVDRRRIYITPTDEPICYPPPYKSMADKINEILDNVPLRPALIHTTYSDMKQLAQYIKHPVLVHDKETKQEVLQQWIDNGGILLGAGMSEGLDLVHDQCRLNIISKVVYPNKGDNFVKKKLALPNGPRWYSLQSAKTLVQSCGRSTRTETDWSFTFVLDSRICRLYSEISDELSESFKEQICWTRVNYAAIRRKIEEEKWDAES